MIKIGLCGTSGAGKGYVSNIFKKYGFECIDTDKIYRGVAIAGSPCLKELCVFFGNEILCDDGTLNRKVLASKVFEGENASQHLKVLNTISHKYVRKKTEEILAELEKKKCKGAIIDAPALFESGFDKMCDYTVFVSAPVETKIKRIIKRDKITAEKAQARLNSQVPEERLRVLCNFEIDNSDGADTEKQIKSLVKGIFGEK